MDAETPLANCNAEYTPRAPFCKRVVEGDIVSGPGVVIGCFSTCKALITTASRL